MFAFQCNGPKRWESEGPEFIEKGGKNFFPEILFICHTVVVIMTQSFAMIILGVIPYKYNRLVKTLREVKAD